MATISAPSASTGKTDVRYQLLGFQEDATRATLTRIASSQAAYDSGGETAAVVLNAVTGAGKTVIATAVIEELLFGGDHHPGDADTTILWVTDDPSLNAQTAEKMMAASEKIHDIRIIGAGRGINQPTLDAGAVYFLNIQAASRTATISNIRDGQQHTIWDTIRNTVRERGSKFLVVVDEAHRGLGAGTRDQATIVSRILNEAPAVPVFLGISATTDRLMRWLDKDDSRTQKAYRVPLDEVQESGLVKDLVLLHNPEDVDRGSASDTTLIREGVRRTREFEAAWAAYTHAQGERPVLPALVVQVHNNVTDGELAEVVDAIRGEWPELRMRQIVNTFGEHTPRDIGGDRVIGYLPPHEIQDSDVRVVIAKDAITTGWDCPRAEVLVSLRTVRDHTSIAQLIGRIVRQPLARRIDTDDTLNKVFAFLPHFDSAGVDQVIAQFAEPGDGTPPITMSRAVLSYVPNPNATAALEALQALPTYDIPRRTNTPPTKRLNAVAFELVHDGIYPDALTEAQRLLNIQLDAEAARIGPTLDEARARLSSVSINVRGVTPDGKVVDTGSLSGNARRDANNIDDLYRQASRTLRDGVAEAYWSYLVDDDEDAVLEHKITVAALGADSTVVAAVQQRAEALVTQWFTKYGKAIAELPDGRRVAYSRIRAQASAPTIDTITVGSVIEEARDLPGDHTAEEIVNLYRADVGNRRPHHVYVDETDSQYWTQVDSPEERTVLDTELQRPELVGWYRNPRGGRRALTIPYELNGEHRGMHPDLIFFHDLGGETKAVLVDPHGPHFADSVPRLAGLVEYAERHGDAYRFIYPVARIGETLRTLALHNQETRQAVRAALNELTAGDTVASIYEQHGIDYR